jgi:GntR family transcriptional repressor for pyruvate dehydrogenase complex
MSDKSENQSKVSQEIAGWILRYAADHQLCGGDRLPSEHHIAGVVGAGRTSVREAFQQLIGRGLVRARAGKGYYWQPAAQPASEPRASFGIQAIRELTEARLILECECAALAAVRATPDDIAHIDAFLNAMETRTTSGVELYEDAIDLHLMIVSAAHNATLSQMARVIIPSLAVLGAELAKEMPDRVELQVAHHRELWTTIRTGDPEAARTAMAIHIRDSASVYLLPYDSQSMVDRA